MDGVLTRKRAKIDVCKEVPYKCTKVESSSSCESSKLYSPKVSFITFEYGPAELNLFKYVADEYQYIWRKMKEIWILKKDSELADGLFLLHGHPLNIKKSCMDLFGFDATTTNFEDREKVPPDEDCIVVCYLRKKEKVQFEEIRKAVKDVKPPRLFFVVDSEVNNEIEAQLKRQRFCPQSHVIKASADKSVIYDEFHNILEEKLKLLFHEVEMKTGTRKVAVFKNQLESLREKLIERKRKTTFQLTDACIRILKTGRTLGVKGYRLRGKTLCIFVNENAKENESKLEELKDSVKDNFKGKVLLHTLTDSSYNPHCSIKCGGYIVNSARNMQGTIGVFAEMGGKIPENLNSAEMAGKIPENLNSSQTIALTSGHIFMQEEFAFTENQCDEIGSCIWPNKNSHPRRNLHDIAVIQLHASVLEKLNKHILNETLLEKDLEDAFLNHRQVFKFGAATGKTIGTIEKIDNFQMFGEKVMIIIQKRTVGDQEKFSDNGDSGAVVLTRDRGKLYAVGMIYGGDFDHRQAECRSSSNESIAINFKNALDRFRGERQITVKLNKI